MPETQVADTLHGEKYRGVGESFREFANRFANAVKEDEKHFHEVRDIVLEQRFLPAGRVQAAMGSPKIVTAFNCFVGPTLDDSFVDGPNSIMNAATMMAQTMRMGGGVGHDFSTLRPRGTRIKSLDSGSSGPVGFMPIYDAIGHATSSAGNRRGAQMGVLRVDHPDVEEFVRAKQNSDRLTGFNVSVAVTDAFMQAMQYERSFTLQWGGQEYKVVDPRLLWEEIMRSTWDWAEPGVLFIDRINELNNLWYCETIAATNPCGEQPLPPHGACLLGSFNLVKYLDMTTHTVVDLARLKEDVPAVVRAMDNVIDRTIYPLPEQEVEAKNKRRMGIGVTGVANALEVIGLPYGSPEFLGCLNQIMRTLTNVLYRASAELAREKGSFPLFDREDYLDGKFVQRLDGDVKDAIAQYGIRNSHLTSIAPTGTISLCADNVSASIEPVYQHETTRRVRTADGEVEMALVDWAYRVHGVRGKTARECSIAEHLAVQEVAQHWTDSSVSKTINVDPATPWDTFKATYTEAFRKKLKGVTTFNPEGKRRGIFIEQGEACRIDEETGQRSCDV